MSRNRMKNSQSLHWMGVVKWVLIASMVSGLGLTYMFCKNQNMHLAAETHRLQQQLAAIESRNKELSGDLEGMKSQARLQKRLRDIHSDLVPWNDPSLVCVSLEQNTHARVARTGTLPKGVMYYDSSVVTASAPQTAH
jgi:uncharacterized protein HemX